MSVGGGESFDNMDLLASEVDPFIPQEAILSKYSIMVYTSNNQKKTFHELKDAKFCASCGEKVGFIWFMSNNPLAVGFWYASECHAIGHFNDMPVFCSP